MSAYPQTGIISRPAGEDLSDYQFCFVKLDSGNVVACTAATDVPLGVLQNKPESGQQAELVHVGPTKVKADGALSEGDLIGPSADGQADPKVPGTDTTEYVCGRVLEAAGSAGVIAKAWINCATPFRAA